MSSTALNPHKHWVFLLWRRGGGLQPLLLSRRHNRETSHLARLSLSRKENVQGSFGTVFPGAQTFRRPSRDDLLVRTRVGCFWRRCWRTHSARRSPAPRTDRYVSSLYFSAIYAGLGENNTALDWLDRAYTERNDRLVYLGAEPMADPLRSDARFIQLMAKIGVH